MSGFYPLSITEVGALLGPETTREMATEAATIIRRHYPGVDLASIPADAWRWIATGEGSPPWVGNAARASATSLMQIFLSLDAEGRGLLLQLAQHIG